jgi:hypothetical protein
MPKTVKHEPSEYIRGQVAAYAATGMQQDVIGQALGLSKTTLRRYYLHELEVSQAKRVAKVAANLYEIAMSPKRQMAQVVASIFLLKVQGKWKETTAIEHSGGTGSVHIAAGSKVVILPSNGREGIAQERLLLRQSPPMIEGSVIEALPASKLPAGRLAKATQSAA